MVALNLSNILAANNTTFLSSSNYTATAGQVKFAANYTVGYVEVYQNGLRLADSDFTAANGEHVILTSAASVSDNIDIVAHKATNISGAALPTTNMIAGTGLTGGGTLAADRTFNLATNIATANLTATGLGHLGSTVAAADPHATDIKSSSHTMLGGTGGNGLFVGGYGSGNTYAQWIQSSFTNPSTATYNLVLQPLGGNLGIGTSSPPDGKLHVHSGTAGSVTAPADSDELVVEGPGNAGITLLAPDGNNTGVVFGNPTDPTAAHMLYVGSQSALFLGTTTSSGVLKLYSGDNSLAATIDSTTDATFEGAATIKKGVPVRTAGGNNVTLSLTDNGKLIYCVNTASAMNIHIPNNSSVAFPVGAEMSFLQHLTHASANTLGFSNAAGVILHSKEAANTVADRFTTAVLKKLATNTWVLAGSLS